MSFYSNLIYSKNKVIIMSNLEIYLIETIIATSLSTNNIICLEKERERVVKKSFKFIIKKQ